MKRIALACFFTGLCLLGVSLQVKGAAPKFAYPFPKKLRMVVSHSFGLGEDEMAKRINLTATKMGIDCLVVAEHNYRWIKRFIPNYSQVLLSRFQPDIVISLQGDGNVYPPAKNYIAMTHASDYYFDLHAKCKMSSLMKYDGFLIAFPDSQKLTTYLSDHQKTANYIPWYTTCPKSEFNPNLKHKLFYCGSNWLNTSYGEKYSRLFSELDRTGFLRVYGKKHQWRHTPKSYRGFIKNDGKTILQTMGKRGISLVLHAPDHFEGKVPTARIFEAAAASTVIISDRHPFIEKEFGDAVLYIDSSNSAHQMFLEIENHVKWIWENPGKARALAKRSHEIFVKKFALEDQLARLLDIHEITPSLENDQMKQEDDSLELFSLEDPPLPL